MLCVKHSDIHLTRGDSGYLDITILLADHAHYVREKGDKLVFTVKDDYKSDVIELQKELPKLELYLEPKDTQNLEYGDHWYDIELTTADDAVYTVIGPARFIVREEVTF